MGIMGRRATVLLGGVAIVLSASGYSASAQDAEDGQAAETTVNSDEKKGRVTRLDRLVVGAGVEKVAIDTPQAVTVVDQADIDSLQATVITDVVENVPGVNATGGSGAFGQNFNIRGVGASESGGEEGRIIFNVDGVNKFFEQYRMGGFFTDPELYKQVEILRGPASSTLYGSGALGGVINFTTKDASDFLGDEYNTVVRLKNAYETNAEAYLGSAVFAHRFNDHAEVLFVGDYRTSSNYTSGDGTEITGTGTNQPNGLAKGTFTFGENMEQELRISYQQYEANAKNVRYDQLNGGATFFPILDQRTVSDKTAIIAYSNDASDNPWLDLNMQVSYSDTFNEQVCTTDPACASFADSDYGYETYQFNIDNTFEHIGGSFENYLTIGNQTAHQKRTRDGSDSASHAEGTDFQTGFFLQNELIWNDRLTVIAGSRFDYQNLSPQTNTVIPAGTPDKDNFGFSPKIAVLYKITDAFSMFGSIAHTERLPTLDEVYQLSGGTFQLDLEPEKSNNFEAGLAYSGYDLLSEGDSLQFKTTGFYNDITNYIEDFGRFAVPRFVNSGNVEIYGAEVEAAYVSDYFYSNAGYSYVRGFNKSTGGYLNTVAPHEFFITVGKTMPDYGLDFGWTSRFVAAQNETVSRSSTPAFDVHDFYVNWVPVEGPLVGWEGRFRVDNVFNEQYQEFLEGFAAEGRTFKFTLVKELGWS
ncbi:TonB-dependent receptor domain-containing protein [Hoeflea prorocentri]|uniref:TonB-dependent receptor n=1 Tax=Hoeflea prorocentri TaxID=1922333 RepID=A0A9X3ZGF0_9HYPH|nr:TonB-dependent receptor [Hoeflea prorocentri]MCY6379680.1 TonB-dependent receptor [Hoeflea prorocentri]MDA5397480.1 TonB-dependent receptor [Hoeflea prorocentri]